MPLAPRMPSSGASDVHRAALALVVAGRLAVQLGHHQPHLAALGDDVAVAAVGAGDVVVVVQRGAHPDRHGLLPQVEVHEAGQLAGGEQVLHPVLEVADLEHPLQHEHQFVVVIDPRCPPCRIGRRPGDPCSDGRRGRVTPVASGSATPTRQLQRWSGIVAFPPAWRPATPGPSARWSGLEHRLGEVLHRRPPRRDCPEEARRALSGRAQSSSAVVAARCDIGDEADLAHFDDNLGQERPINGDPGDGETCCDRGRVRVDNGAYSSAVSR